MVRTILAVAFATNVTLSKSVTGCGAAGVAKSLALSAATKLTSLGKYASSIFEVVSGRIRTFGKTTVLTGLGSNAGSVDPGVTGGLNVCIRLDVATYGTSVSCEALLSTRRSYNSVSDGVTKSRALSETTTMLTGLGSSTGSVSHIMTKSLTLSSATNLTNLRKNASSIHPGMTKSLAVSKSADGTGSSRIAISCSPAVICCHAFGLAAGLTGLRSGTGSLCPVVTGSSALYRITNCAMLSMLAIAFYPSVSLRTTADRTAKLTGSGLYTISLYPLMLERVAFRLFTNGTGLGGLAGSLGPVMAKSLAFGLAALTSLGGLASCICPFVLVFRFRLLYTNHTENFVNLVVNGVGELVAGSECEQKDH